MTSGSRRHDGFWLLLVAALPIAAPAEETRFDWAGHVKTRALAEAYPPESLFRDLIGAQALDGEADLRLKLEVDRGRWTVHGDYQAFAVFGDSLDLARTVSLAPGLEFARLPDDDRRLFDLTHVISDGGDARLLQRLDQLWVGYTSERTVLRVGRQAITWGGGLFFSPFDIVNPFDPAAIDTEYKAGDDMLYGQYLKSDGDDLQFAYVARRDPLSGSATHGESTAAVKYHGIAGDSEFDVLLADNYGRTTLGLGGNRDIGGAVLRADILLADADEWTWELVTNLSYSWAWWGKNVSGVVEYYYNGYGQKNGRYGPAALAANPELLRRLARGETFSIGRHYLGAGVTIELTPLWLLTPNVFANVEDPSALLQVIAQYSLGDNLTLLAALNVPAGADGSEYGGVEVIPSDRYLSRTAGIFLQLAWYF